MIVDLLVQRSDISHWVGMVITRDGRSGRELVRWKGTVPKRCDHGPHDIETEQAATRSYMRFRKQLCAECFVKEKARLSGDP